jgi:hypothetical protein
MGSVHGLSSVHNAHEPCDLALDPALALALPSGIKSKSKSKSKSRDRFMGSVHGLSVVHDALEPRSSDLQTSKSRGLLEEKTEGFNSLRFYRGGR